MPPATGITASQNVNFGFTLSTNSSISSSQKTVYKSVGQYNSYKNLTYNINVTTTSEILAESSISLNSFYNYTVLVLPINPNSNTSQVITLSDLNIPSNTTAFVRLINVAPINLEFVLQVVNVSAILGTFSNVSYTQGSQYLELQPYTYNFNLYSTSNTSKQLISTSQEIVAGIVYSIFIFGNTNTTLSLVIVQDYPEEPNLLELSKLAIGLIIAGAVVAAVVVFAAIIYFNRAREGYEPLADK